MTSRCLLIVAVVLWLPIPARAHDIPGDIRIQSFLRQDGQRLRLLVRAPVAAMTDIEWPSRGVLIDLTRIDPVLREAAAAWLIDRIDLYEHDRRLERPDVSAVRLSLPSDTSFDTYAGALALVLGPGLAPDTELVASQAMVDALFEYPVRSAMPRFSIATRFESAGLRSVTTLRFTLAAGVERAFQLHGDSGVVPLDPRWFQAARRFVVDGFLHILDGVDHLLFLCCLVIPFRRLGALVPIVTSFTVAHSITLIASAYDMAPGALWFPPLVETLIASSIVYMAIENIVSPRLRRRWMITFAFGLVHGFGFSFALRETLQFAGPHVLTSLLAFNVGVEFGQLAVLIVVLPALHALFRFGVAERAGTLVLSALIAHTGWHWMTERGGQLARYRFEWPVFDAAFFALLLRWMVLAVALSGVAWLIFGVLWKRGATAGEPVSTRSAGSA